MKFNLDSLVIEFKNLEKELSNPEIFKNQKKVREVSKRKKTIEKAVILYKKYKKLNKLLQENKEMLKEEKDPEMKDLIKLEIDESDVKILEFEEKLKIALLPKDENDDKNIIVEIRAGT
jgi:peptide chain release factor 1